MASRTAVADYNVRDPKLPGSSLIEAIFNRRLMSWSDRGGASMLLGDAWAHHCQNYLAASIGRDAPVPNGESFRLRTVLRLDENPAVEREANLNQLTNPDFLLIGQHAEDTAIVQAADAKFAADRLKKHQVSIEAVENLLTVPERGATRTLLGEALEGISSGQIVVVPGIFLSPDSPFTDALLQRARKSRSGPATNGTLVRIPVDPATLFDGSERARLIPTVARVDQLTVSPRENLLAAVYYLRIVCACFYLWDEQTRPFFAEEREQEPPEIGLVAGEVARRASEATSAYNMAVSWHRDLRDITMGRKAVSDAISLPIGVDEIRRAVGIREANAKAKAREARGSLERAYRARLLEDFGPIYANDPRPLKQLVKELRVCSRALRPELLEELDSMGRS